jgi:hypothetical protein
MFTGALDEMVRAPIEKLFIRFGRSRVAGA